MKEGAVAENGEKGIPKKWMKHMSFWPLGIQTGPFGACQANCVKKCPPFCDLSIINHILLPERGEGREGQGQKMGKGERPNAKTVLSNWFKDSPRKPLGRRPKKGIIQMWMKHRVLTIDHWPSISPNFSEGKFRLKLKRRHIWEINQLKGGLN